MKSGGQVTLQAVIYTAYGQLTCTSSPMFFINDMLAVLAILGCFISNYSTLIYCVYQ